MKNQKTLLIIDDDSSILCSLELHFRESGYSVLISDTISEGKFIFDEYKPD